MIIKVNGEMLDVTLENEKTAYDIIDSLILELNKREMVISSIKINEHYYTLEDEELKSFFIEDISEINVEVSKKEELVMSLLEECKNMLHNISNDLKKNGYTHVKEFNELFQWITETIQSINKISLFNMMEVRLISSTIDQILEYLNNDEKNLNKIESLSAVLESLVKYLEAIELKINTNFTVTKEQILEAINGCIEVLPEISEAFQMGKDKDALSKINTVISVLELCCIYLRKNLYSFSEIEHDEIDNLYNEINALLTQIVEAFENGDIVLLGDLLEYELPEKLENYKGIILGEVE